MVATFRGFLDGKDDFARGHVFGPFFIIRCGQSKTRTICEPSRRKDPERRTAASFRLGLQFGQMGVELVFGDSFTAVELLDSASDFGIDGFAVL